MSIPGRDNASRCIMFLHLKEDIIEESAGDPRFPVWLIADSEPKRWGKMLDTPLDPRHPACHSIWTSVLNYVQDKLYRQDKRRFNTEHLYIRNAVTDSDDKPENITIKWPEKLQKKGQLLETYLLEYNPVVVITFGIFAFEFLRRARNEKPVYAISHWGAESLGTEFNKRTDKFNSGSTNIIPLLHVSIARGNFLKSHKYFVGEKGDKQVNYFEYVGNRLAELFLSNLRSENIWID